MSRVGDFDMDMDFWTRLQHIDARPIADHENEIDKYEMEYS